MRPRHLLPALAGVALLAAAAPPAASAQDGPRYVTAMSEQVIGGSVPHPAGGRTVYGYLHFGGVPGAYEVIERRTADGTWKGRFTLYRDRVPITGTTTLTPGRGRSYTRVWRPRGTESNCFSPSGELVGTGSFGRLGTFSERLEGTTTCHGNGPGHGPAPPSRHRFRVKLHVTSYEGYGHSVIGRMSSGRSQMMNTVDGGIARLLCGIRRCAIEVWDTRGAVFGSFPVRVQRRGGRFVYRPGPGRTQIGGHGDPEYRGVRATAPWSLRGSLDRDRRGTLTLSGGIFR